MVYTGCWYVQVAAPTVAMAMMDGVYSVGWWTGLTRSARPLQFAWRIIAGD